MAILLHEWPEDVLLKLARELDVSDLIHLLSTCRSLRELQDHRTLWLDAITRIQRVQHHPLPLFALPDPVDLPLSQLQAIVQRTNRLLRNIRSDVPRPVWTRSISLGEPGQIVCIPTTHLVVSSTEDTIICWDARTGERVTELQVDHIRLTMRTPCMDVTGQALLGATVRLWSGNSAKLALVILDFSDRRQVHFRSVVSPPFSQPENHNEDLYLSENDNEDFFLSAQLFGFTTKTHIYYWALDANKIVQKMHNPWGNTMRADCHGSGSICLRYMHSAASRRLWVFNPGGYRADAAVDSIPLDVDAEQHPRPEDNSVILPVQYSFAANEQEAHQSGNLSSMSLSITMLFAPEYNIFAVTWRGFKWDTVQPSFMHFWPAFQSGDDGELAFQLPICFSHPGTVQQLAAGVSGRYVLLLLGSKQNDNGRMGTKNLGLLYLDPSGNPIFRELHLTGEAAECLERERAPFYDLAFDDTLGLVMVVDRTGLLTVVSYA
ncbi:hypothetical protein C8F01DRAFT_1112734 [Mycena amicta]|nr:hypothetical protein C8F01DRAFT_1112734 [Mycena amicta]